MNRISFALIGGGPAAFYISKLLTRMPFQPYVDIYEKQLCPFGLLRYGVAPDHISIKKSQIVLSQVTTHPHFRYFGNTNINTNSIQQLKQKYSGIIYAYGASQNHTPSWLKETNFIKNSKIKHARDLVYWYNGHPDKQNTRQNLKNIKNVTIVGNGNVAIDVARILLRKPLELQKTEISKQALEELKQCDIQNIEILGRRGVTHSAFSVKQIRQLHKLGIKIYAIREELQDSMTPASQIECTSIGDNFNSVVRMNKRKIDFIREAVTIISEKQIEKERQKPFKKIFLRYLLNPKRVQGENTLICDKTALYGQPFHQKSAKTGQQNKINFDLLVISTGFEVQPLQIDHYDLKNKKVHNSDGCVINSKGNIDIGTYAVGWCKTGPQGVIDQTLLGCQETLNNIRIHVQNNVLATKPLVQEPENNISFQKYEKVRQLQLSRGNKEKFIKRKLTNKELMQFYGLSLNITKNQR